MIQHQCVCGELYYDCNYWQHADCKPAEPIKVEELPEKAIEKAVEPKKRGRPPKNK